MSTFSPYVVIEDSPAKLHLKESSTRRNIILFVLRFVPVFYVLFAGYLIIYQSQRLPSVVIGFLSAMLFIAAIFMFTRKLITELIITKTGIDIVYNIFFQQKETSYPISFIDYISQRKRGGKAPAYTYYAIIKADKKKQRIFKISSFNMSKEKQLAISDKLEALTGLKVVSERFLL